MPPDVSAFAKAIKAREHLRLSGPARQGAQALPSLDSLSDQTGLHAHRRVQFKPSTGLEPSEIAFRLSRWLYIPSSNHRTLLGHALRANVEYIR